MENLWLFTIRLPEGVLDLPKVLFFIEITLFVIIFFCNHEVYKSVLYHLELLCLLCRRDYPFGKYWFVLFDVAFCILCIIS
jgi:hypothetical protein